MSDENICVKLTSQTFLTQRPIRHARTHGHTYTQINTHIPRRDTSICSKACSFHQSSFIDIYKREDNWYSLHESGTTDISVHPSQIREGITTVIGSTPPPTHTHVVDLIFGFAYMNAEFLKCIFQGKTVSIGKDLQWSQHVLVEKYRGATYVCVWGIVVIKSKGCFPFLVHRIVSTMYRNIVCLYLWVMFVQKKISLTYLFSQYLSTGITLLGQIYSSL